jgi:hypothetical protein
VRIINQLHVSVGDETYDEVRFSGVYNVPLDANPFASWASVVDCGDIPVTS